MMTRLRNLMTSIMVKNWMKGSLMINPTLIAFQENIKKMLSKEYKYLVHTSRKLTVCSIGAPHLKPLSVAFTCPPEASRCNLCLFYIMNTNCLIKKALGSVVGDLTNSSKSKMSRSQREIR